MIVTTFMIRAMLLSHTYYYEPFTLICSFAWEQDFSAPSLLAGRFRQHPFKIGTKKIKFLKFKASNVVILK